MRAEKARRHGKDKCAVSQAITARVLTAGGNSTKLFFIITEVRLICMAGFKILSVCTSASPLHL